MNKETQKSITSRLKKLSDSDLKYIFGELLDSIETEISPPVTDEEIEEQTQKDKEFLQQVAVKLNVDTEPITSEKDGAIQFLIVVTEVFPEYAQIIEQGLIQLEQPDTTLGSVSSSFVPGILVIALATAIIRPNVEFKRTLITAGKEKQEIVEISVTGTGIDNAADDLATLLKAASSFISSQ